jgi:hypothetical protein
MTDRDLDRIENDLATIQRAAGLELPFGREDVWLNLLLGAGGIVALFWALAPHGLPHHWGLVPLLILTLVYGTRLRNKYRRSTGRSPIRRREYTIGFVLAIVFGGFALVYRVWGARLGIPLAYVQGSVIFFMGMAFLVPAIMDHRSRIYLVALSVPMILCGLAIPAFAVSAVVLFGGALAIAGPSMAAVQVWQLNRSRPGHAAD